MATQNPYPDVKVEADPCTLTSASCDASVLPMHVPSPMTSSDDPVTPKSMTDDATSPRALSVIPEQSPEPVSTLSAEDKESARKRKSWGQVLPEPKTNLPPRKRAKTDDEKEQRRVERVLRNRRAAQSSRERKRLETEALENRNKELESELLDAQQANFRLLEEIKNLRLHLGIPSSQPPLESLCNKPITLSSQLFGSSNNTEALPGHSANLVGQILSSVIPTVDPSSLSPKLAPSPEQGESPRDKPVGQQTKRPSPDLTQRPAVSRVGGCGSVVANSLGSYTSPLGLGPAAQDDITLHLDNVLCLPLPLDADRNGYERRLLATPDSSNYEDYFAVGDFTAAGFAPSDTDTFFDMGDYINEDASCPLPDAAAASDEPDAGHDFEHQVPDPQVRVS